MNIIEAIKSGKRFRRKSQPNKGYWYQEGAGLTFYEDDILADDWEIEEVSCYAGCVTITRDEFYAAWDKALDKSIDEAGYEVRDLLADELGL